MPNIKPLFKPFLPWNHIYPIDLTISASKGLAIQLVELPLLLFAMIGLVVSAWSFTYCLSPGILVLQLYNFNHCRDLSFPLQHLYPLFLLVVGQLHPIFRIDFFTSAGLQYICMLSSFMCVTSMYPSNQNSKFEGNNYTTLSKKQPRVLSIRYCSYMCNRLSSKAKLSRMYAFFYKVLQTHPMVFKCYRSY